MNSLNPFIDQWVRPELRAQSAYHVADAGGLIKLDAMENPYIWPGALQSLWLERLSTVAANRYPDPAATALKTQLRASLNLPDTVELLLGNGSDEIIQMLALMLGGVERTILALEPSFVMYRLIAKTTGLNYIGVALRSSDFAMDEAAVLAALAQHRPALVFIAYPNNPTGNLFDHTTITRIIAAAPGLVVLDEAYAPFTNASFRSELLHYPNLLVLGTLSKMGLAGLRLGYIMGAPEWIRELDKTRMPYNINVLTQISATLALEHKQLLDAQTQCICTERERLYKELGAWPAIHVFPSQANFLLFQVAPGRAPEVFHGLKLCGVLIKNLDGVHPLLANSLRVTVGTSEENAAFMTALRQVLE